MRILEKGELRKRDKRGANRDGTGFQANANIYHKNHLCQRGEDCAHARWWVYRHTLLKLLELTTLIGVRGLYTGLTASVFRQMTYSVTRLGVYDLMKNTMSNNGAKKLRTGDMVICASVAGALGGVAGNPADIILVRYVVPGSNQAFSTDKPLLSSQNGRRPYETC